MNSTFKLVQRCSKSRTGIARLIFTATIAFAAGCTIYENLKERKEITVPAITPELTGSHAYKDTIGALAYYEGLTPMRVRGYGLVVGLGKNGSSDCPKPVFERLVQSLYKQQRLSSSIVGVKDVTPEQLIASLDTAVVVVQGEIPPAAINGSHFDVSVMALPGTSTKSLLGGRLYTTELELFKPLPSGVSLMGQSMARAAGPLFLNPFADAGSATKSQPLQGIVVGGGLVTQDRRVRLVLSSASYSDARRIQERINSHFTGAPKVADAISPSFVQIHIPAEYREDGGHFLALVRSLYLSREPSFEASRARQLADEMVNPSAPHALIALCFEGLNRAALPVLDELYKHPKDYVSFHAAVAGARLEDPVAHDALAHHASRPQSEYRFQAIRALGEARQSGAAGASLRKLLIDSDPRVQVAAYEALVLRNDMTVHSKVLGGDNFRLDVIPASGTHFIYAKRSGSRRIAVFGSDLRCTPPILYRSPDGALTVNAASDATALSVIRTVVSSAATTPPFTVNFELVPLIELMGADAAADNQGIPMGLGLDYGSVVRALHYLCESKAVDARFILEQPNAAEIFGPPRAITRPESEF